MLNERYLSQSPTFWQPHLWPEFESQVAPWSPLVWPLRLIRILWVILTTPIWIAFVTLHYYAPALTSSFEPPVETWSYRRRILLPLLSRIIWSMAGFGTPPKAYGSARFEEGIPTMTTLSRSLVGYHVERTHIPPADENWLPAEARDPRGLILPRRVPAFWINARDAKPLPGAPQVVLLLAGGGYLLGHALESNRALEPARRLGVPVLGISYRKATLDLGAYPAALQDALSAYQYLCQQGCTKIAILGDSAGGGLALTLLFNLATLARTASMKVSVVLPTHMVLCSPWTDLTVSNPSIANNARYDILNPAMCECGGYMYTRYLNGGKTAAEGSLELLGRAHPSISPALPSGRHLFDLLKRDFDRPPKFFVCWGGLELFDDECTAVASHISDAGLDLQTIREPDEVHCYPILPPLVASPAADSTWQAITDFVVG